MKVRRFGIEPLEFDVECNFLGKMYVMLNIWLFVKVGKITTQLTKPIYRVYVPKFNFKKG